MENIKIHTLSSTGRRETNQDSFLKLGLENKNFVFIAVADGMGGVTGGEKASKSVIECCEKIIREKFEIEKTPDLKQTLRKIFFEAQKKIRQEIEKNPDLNGMGTTLACLLIHEDKFVWGNLGDSRIYYYSNSNLNLVTKDHTHIQEFIDENKAPLTQSMIDNYGNLLTRSIDGGTDEPDIYPEDAEFKILSDGEAFLLCSDGLIENKAIDNSGILENFIIGTKNLSEAAIKLIDMAIDNGSTDNITVVLLEKGKIKRKKISNLGTAVLPVRKIQVQSGFKNHYNKILIVLASLVTIVSILITFLFYKQTNIRAVGTKHSNPISESRNNAKTNLDSGINNHDENNISSQEDIFIEEENKITKSSDLGSQIQNKNGEIKTKINDQKLIIVPDVVGLSYEEAKIILEKRNFICITSYIQGPEINKGKVIKSLKSGTRQKLNSKITIIVGK